MTLEDFTFGELPTKPGRYLVMTRCAASACRDFMEPGICCFDGTKFHVGGVIGWAGPIPIMRVADHAGAELTHLGSRPPLEYDL